MKKRRSWLSALTFGYGRICQVPLEQVRQRLIECLARWGKPGAMRVDNGEPLGHPTMRMTSPLALWLIAIDIDMIWNKPIADVQLRCRHDDARNKTGLLKICKLLHGDGLNWIKSGI